MFQRTTFLTAALFATAGAAPAQERAVIALGWDTPRPATFRAEVGALEAQGVPLDGTAIRFTARDANGERSPFRTAFAGSFEDQDLSGPLREAWLQESIDHMLNSGATQITQNFLRLRAQPGDVDFFDDAGWSTILETARLAGYAAREAQLAGILFDPEPYTEPFAQFDYLRAPQLGQHTFEEYVAQARLRGQQFMTAIQSEFPDVTILSLFLNSYQLTKRFRGPSAFGHDSPSLALAGGAYALFPAFIDGWLDVAAPTVTIVDGHEESYYHTTELDFELAALRMRQQGLDLVSPQNRARYQAQVQVGFAVYLDSYDAAHPLALTLPSGLTYPELFEQNLSLSLRAADQYVWVYGEGGSFFSRPQSTPWATYRPWLIPSMQSAVDPANWPTQGATAVEDAGRVRTEDNRLASWARDQFRAALQDGPLDARNIARNADFADDTSSWGLYIDPALGTSGSLSWQPEGDATPGSARVVDANSASVFQQYEVVPGEKLWLSAAFRRNGWSEPRMTLGWRMANNVFIARERTEFFAEEYEPVQSGELRSTDWSTISGAVEVPAGAEQLVLTLSVTNQQNPEDNVDFDDVVVLPVGGPADGPDLGDVAATGMPLLNSGFEAGLDGWFPDSTTPVLAVNDAFSGVFAARVGPGTGGLSREVSVQPGKRVQLRVHAKQVGENDASYVGLRYRSASGALLSDAPVTRRVRTNSYREYVVNSVAPQGAATVLIFAWKAEEGSFLAIDDVRLDVRDPLDRSQPLAR